MTTGEIPTAKSQNPTNGQIPNPNAGHAHGHGYGNGLADCGRSPRWDLEVGILLGFGFWSLGFLIFPQMSKFFTSNACFSMKSLLGSTSSPIRIEKIRSAFTPSSMVIFTSVRFSGSIVVSQS